MLKLPELLTFLETKLNEGIRSGLYVVEDAFIYVLLYRLEDYTTFKAIQIFLKYNLNKSEKNLYNNITDTDKIQDSKSSTVVIICFIYIVTRLKWFI